MRYLIIIPRYKPYGKYYELPLGLGYISSALKRVGIETKVINLNHINASVETIMKREVRMHDTVCTGGLSTHYPQIQEIFKHTPDYVRKVCGGGIITSEPHLMTKALGIDVPIIGEGEGPIVDLALTGKCEPRICDINDIPYPDYEGMGVHYWLDRQRCMDEHYLYVEDYPRAMPILSSRGCPYNCTFCFSPLGKKYRYRSISNFFDEVEHLCSSYNINILTILDETIGLSPSRLEDICKGMKKFKLKWMTQMRVDIVTPDLLAMMKDSGCYQISYGVESGSQKVLDSMKKKTTVPMITKALEQTYDTGIGIQGGIIFGDAAETKETFLESMSWNNKHRKFTLNIMSVSAFPGTELYNKYVKKLMSEEQRLNWIKAGCDGYINVTSMPAELVHGILKSIQIDNLADLYMQATVLRAEVTGTDEHLGPIIEFDWVCPHCDRTNTFKNVVHMHFLLLRPPMLALGTKLGCRYCNARSTQVQWSLHMREKIKKEGINDNNRHNSQTS